jgi:hypothetical protein
MALRGGACRTSVELNLMWSSTTMIFEITRRAVGASRMRRAIAGPPFVTATTTMWIAPSGGT